jgi:ATP-dependent Clp protease adaptor protein ClpS
MQASRTSADTETDSMVDLEPSWHVIVLNDPVNLMSYVVMVFRRVFGYNSERAKRHMMEVHHQGRSLVWTGGREKAEAYTHTLQKWQLTAILERDG